VHSHRCVRLRPQLRLNARLDVTLCCLNLRLNLCRCVRLDLRLDLLIDQSAVLPPRRIAVWCRLHSCLRRLRLLLRHHSAGRNLYLRRAASHRCRHVRRYLVAVLLELHLKLLLELLLLMLHGGRLRQRGCHAVGSHPRHGRKSRG
jgi:hypothetical protein